jgi:hypothetical protein
MHEVSEVHVKCRSAIAVWMALLQLAANANSLVFRTGRAKLIELSGINNKKTISLALAALSDAGWLTSKRITTSTGNSIVACLQIKLHISNKNYFQLDDLDDTKRQTKSKKTASVTRVAKIDRKLPDPVKPDILSIPVHTVVPKDVPAFIERLEYMKTDFNQQYQKMCSDSSDRTTSADRSVWLAALGEWRKEADDMIDRMKEVANGAHLR